MAIKKTAFPGIAKVKTDLRYRSIGPGNSMNRLGAGFMRKSGVYKDCINLRFPYYVIVYVLNGSGTYIDNKGNSYAVQKGDMFQRFPYQEHSNYVDPDSDWVECYIDIGKSCYDALVDCGLMTPQPVLKNYGIDQSLIYKIWTFKESLRSCAEELLPDLTIDFFETIKSIMQTYRCKTSNDSVDHLEAAYSYLGSDFTQHKTFKEFCSRNGLGYEKYRKLFQLRMGVSPGQYRIRRRLDAGCRMLHDLSLNITEISMQLGYTTQYDFSAQFKKHFGISPRHYRDGLGKEQKQ